MRYGYIRCSTNEMKQDISRQEKELVEKHGLDKANIFREYEHGDKAERRELNRLLGILQAGDEVYTTEISRISRSTKQLCEIIDLVKDKKIMLVMDKFVVDCRHEELDPMTRGMLQMMSVFAELELNMIRQRVKSGVANARAKGKRIGRPQVTVDTLPKAYIKYYPQFYNSEITGAEFARLANISRQTIYKYNKFYRGVYESEI